MACPRWSKENSWDVFMVWPRHFHFRKVCFTSGCNSRANVSLQIYLQFISDVQNWFIMNFSTPIYIIALIFDGKSCKIGFYKIKLLTSPQRQLQTLWYVTKGDPIRKLWLNAIILKINLANLLNVTKQLKIKDYN